MPKPASGPSRGAAQSRRAFLKRAAAATASVASGAATANWLPAYGRDQTGTVFIVPAQDDPAVSETPVQWALEHLRASLNRRGLQTRIHPTLGDLPSNTFCIVVATDASPLAQQVLDSAHVALPKGPEAMRLVRGKAGGRVGGRSVLLAGGSDARGLVHALLELADRAEFAADPMTELNRVEHIIQHPANEVRSVARLFVSELEDKPWFNDRSFWERYLTELATQRFNRFSLMLGLGYDFPRDIRDAYFHFAYPFLIAVPGYAVRAAPLPEPERERNLAMLQFISQEAARRGLHFQLGLWTHAWQWADSPKVNYVIEGLSPATHAPYCRDALDALLRACPAISGVTLRIHGESGIAEGSYDFWQTVFEGAARCGRRVELDLHAKGIDEKMIDLALATGLPVKVSPKFWAEHMGLGYMQGAIRPLEMPPREGSDQGFFAKSSGSRRFLRYGYGDLLAENRRYGVLHRLWPGTQRLLLWGSPELAADYGRAASFCGSAGLEWCEPLSFKGRKGSGLPGGRDAYADASLRPAGGDFEKYRYGYRVWGRHLYDPNCEPDEWRRYLRRQFGPGAPSLETALQAASRILPLITTAHCPSAANNNYWPEIYTNMAIVDAKRPHPYGDTLSPKRFGTVSPLDPEFFSRIDDCADELLHGGPGAKYSPAWVAASLQSAAAMAETALATAARKVRDPQNAEFRRFAADIRIQNGLGQFFAWKFRAAALFALHQRSGYSPALEEAIKAYRQAREAWAKMAEAAARVYRRDVTFGPEDFQRGHWLDRLPAIDADIADMEKLLQHPGTDRAPAPAAVEPQVITRAINAVLQAPPEPPRLALPDFHRPLTSFRRGEPIRIEVSVGRGSRAPKLKSIRLRFRRVNQAETWQMQDMEPQGAIYWASIPAAYTDSPFPLQYHFECHEPSGAAWLFPGLTPAWHAQPYFLLRQSG